VTLSRQYKCLQLESVNEGEFSLTPIREDDKFLIMKWRNEQLFHLRQAKPLTEQQQIEYFQIVVEGLFNKSKPEQLLFSYLKGGVCLGYGGLVHINWIDRNAELSFIMDTELENDSFQNHWTNFLKMIEKIAFERLAFHKIFTYAFDLRPHLYTALEFNGFINEARLKDHCFYNGQFVDVVLHCKIDAKPNSEKSI
jgi:RimJ/RimL family protein N-acetyltransferase